MNIALVIQNVTEIANGLWRASLTPNEMTCFGGASSRIGNRSIVLVFSPLAFDGARGRLELNPETARLLNAGHGNEVLFIESLHSRFVERLSGSDREKAAVKPPGDETFVQMLPRELENLGVRLLEAVRSRYHGELRFHESSKKFVETPDNFWTIRIQPRVGDFRITVRGTPSEFASNSMQMKDDMAGYTTFKIQNAGQLGEFLEILGQVRKK